MTHQQQQQSNQNLPTWTINGNRPKVDIPKTGPLVRTRQQRPPAFMPGRADQTPAQDNGTGRHLK